MLFSYNSYNSKSKNIKSVTYLKQIFYKNTLDIINEPDINCDSKKILIFIL